MAPRPKKKRRRKVAPRGPYMAGPEAAAAVEKLAETLDMSAEGIVGPVRHPSKPVAFRLPMDVIGMADRAAQANHVSRNKLVELVLRNTLKTRYGATPEARDERQFDLFA